MIIKQVIILFYSNGLWPRPAGGSSPPGLWPRPSGSTLSPAPPPASFAPPPPPPSLPATFEVIVRLRLEGFGSLQRPRLPFLRRPLGAPSASAPVAVLRPLSLRHRRRAVKRGALTTSHGGRRGGNPAAVKPARRKAPLSGKSAGGGACCGSVRGGRGFGACRSCAEAPFRFSAGGAPYQREERFLPSRARAPLKRRSEPRGRAAV